MSDTTDESLEARLVEAADKALRGLTPSVIPASDGFAFVWPSNYARHLTVAVLAQIKADGMVLVGVEDLQRILNFNIYDLPKATVTHRLWADAHGRLRAVLAAFDADTEQPEAR